MIIIPVPKHSDGKTTEAENIRFCLRRLELLNTHITQAQGELRQMRRAIHEYTQFIAEAVEKFEMNTLLEEGEE